MMTAAVTLGRPPLTPGAFLYAVNEVSGELQVAVVRGIAPRTIFLGDRDHPSKAFAPSAFGCRAKVSHEVAATFARTEREAWEYYLATIEQDIEIAEQLLTEARERRRKVRTLIRVRWGGDE